LQPVDYQYSAKPSIFSPRDNYPIAQRLLSFRATKAIISHDERGPITTRRQWKRVAIGPQTRDAQMVWVEKTGRGSLKTAISRHHENYLHEK
jgi:hypothetical protein